MRKRVNTMSCDNSKEHLNYNISDLINNTGIFLEPYPPYVHELKGTAER